MVALNKKYNSKTSNSVGRSTNNKKIIYDYNNKRSDISIPYDHIRDTPRDKYP